tara:strand:+ start:5288 stop:5911 length:624 start_codon:yes stop_codon:yes gene_type:complete
MILALTSCSSPLNKPYDEETIEEDTKAIKESGKLTEEDGQLMAGWIIKAKLSGEDLEGKTYSQILSEAKDYKKEQQELSVKAKAEEEERKIRLGSALTVALYDKGYTKYDYEDYLTYSLAFQNKTEKDIRAFTGMLSIRDLFDKEIKSINLTIDDPIIAGQTFKGSYTTDYNQFSDEDTRLRNKDLDDLIVEWIPEKIIFTDGSTLE